MADDPDSAELAHFGKYILDQEIARGGMSRVFRARLRGPGGFEKKLVVKQILPELAADPSFVELFVKEAIAVVQMSHPNLVPVYELGVIDEVYFLAMEWVEGATVAELLRDGPLPEALVAQIGAQIAEALRYAHERFQIVHRDVTPRNIIIDGAGHARLLDFGIAAQVGHAGQGELFGSPGYMAPEQVRGEALGPESDIFSLGCVLYEAISGNAAFPVTRSGSTILTSSTDPPPLAASESSLSGLISRLLARDRKQRPANAAEVSDTLRTWLAERHPRGVDGELAALAMRAHALREAEPKGPSEMPAASSGRIEVRSLAVSPALTELLQHATERIARASPAPVPATEPDDIANDPELHRIARRLMRDGLVLSVALVGAVYYAQYTLRDDPDRSHANGSKLSAQHEPKPQPPIRQRPPPPLQPMAAAQNTANALRPTAAEAGAAAASDSAKKLGYLTVSASPWAEVHVDGHAVGVTPKRNLPLRAGKHTLTLTNPPLDREAKLSIDLEPGQNLRVVANLQEQPPKIDMQ